MNLKSPTFSIILVSLIAAGAILAASVLLDGRETAQTITYIIIAIWWIPFTILAARRIGQSPKEDA